jgi:tRNA-modifying protein YgfZ
MNNDRASFDQQYEALKSGGAIVDLAAWTSISITGKDRQSFLHNFCTNDVKRLVPGSSCEAFFTNVKGKIVGHGLIACREDELVFLGPPGQGEKLVAHLDRYVIREDVQLRDTTSQKWLSLIAGADPGVLEDVHTQWSLLGRDDVDIVEAKANSTSVPSLLLKQGFVAGSEVFDAVRIEAGMPLFGVDFDDSNLPQEVGRDQQAISFTKGCYLGQETVARIDALGHVNQRIVGVRFVDSETPVFRGYSAAFGSEIPKSGLELLNDGSVAGHVTSACYSPKLRAPLGLAMVRRGANAIGTRLESTAGECEVVGLPA